MAKPPKKARSTPGKKKSAALDNVSEYRHEEATRKNNPPAKIAAEGVVPLMAKIKYEYSPRLAPVLRFDPTGAPDKLPALLAEAKKRPLKDEELTMLAEALGAQDPWLEWANKREKRHFEVDPVALHIHERVSPQAILRVAARQDIEPSLFGDPQQQYHEAVQFYRHEIPWTNRLILGDSLQVMASLSRREDLAGKVQMIYMDPPYGIKFGSNFQPEVGNRDVKDKEQDLTRELEMVKAYRDTWYLGIHSYLSYLRDRLVLAKELLADSGSIFLQIGAENVHRVRSLMDELFDRAAFMSLITVKKTATPSSTLDDGSFYLLWYARNPEKIKFRPIYLPKPCDEWARDTPGGSWGAEIGGVRRSLTPPEKENTNLLPQDARVYCLSKTTSAGPSSNPETFDVFGESFPLKTNEHWKTGPSGRQRLVSAERIELRGRPWFTRFYDDGQFKRMNNIWEDTAGKSGQSFYVVKTETDVIARCLLMATDAGDLVLDPTCGGGTTAFVAEQWGRRWITTDTSRVAIAIARQRLLTQGRFDYYELRGVSEADLRRNPNGPWLTDPMKTVEAPCTFKLGTLPHITLKSIAQNTNLDSIFSNHQPVLDKALAVCNSGLKHVTDAVRDKIRGKLLRKQKDEGRKAITDADRRRWELPEKGKRWEHWQIPFDTDPDWPSVLADAVTEYRKAWRTKMDEVNACISANAEPEELVDQPEVVKGIVRVSGPFTVEAVQPPEMSLGETHVVRDEAEFGGAPDELETFPPISVTGIESRLDQEAQNVEAYLDQMLRLIKLDGVRFPNNKEMKFSRLEPVRDGSVIHAEGRWANGEKDSDPEGKANVGVVFGPQYGPITAMQVEESIRQANRRGYDHLVLAGFSFDGASQAVIAEAQHPRMKIHAANISPDVNPGMAGLLKEQRGSQLFTVFGQPRTKIDGPNKDGEYTVTMEGVDIYNPVENSITPTKADKVAAWFIDGDYDGRTFCITQAFFPDKDAWSKLSKALDGVVDPERFEALSGTTSLPFPPGKHKTVAVKVIDPRGNEVMSVHPLKERHG